MKTTLLSAAAALVLTTMPPVFGFAQQNGDDGYRSPANEGYGTQYRGGYGRRSDERQNNPNGDRVNDRWGGMNAMMNRRGGARFRFSRGNASIDIRCPQNESLQDCVEAASRLIDKVRSLGPGPDGRQGAAASPENRTGPGATPSQQ
jgi:hypothetical protein